MLARVGAATVTAAVPVMPWNAAWTLAVPTAKAVAWPRVFQSYWKPTGRWCCWKTKSPN